MRILLSLFVLFGGLNVILARSIYRNFHDSPTLNWFSDYDYDLFTSIPAAREEFADEQDVALAELFDSLLEPFLVDGGDAKTQKTEEIIEEIAHKDDESNDYKKEDTDGNDGLTELFESLLKPFLVDDGEDDANTQKIEEISRKDDENNDNEKEEIDGNDGLDELFESLLEPFLVDGGDANAQKTEEIVEGISRKNDKIYGKEKEEIVSDDEESNEFNIEIETEVAKSPEKKINDEEVNDDSKNTLLSIGNDNDNSGESTPDIKITAQWVDLTEKDPQEVVVLIKSTYGDDEEFSSRLIHEYLNLLHEVSETKSRKNDDEHNDKDDSNEDSDHDDDDVTTTPKDDSNEDNDDNITTTPKDNSNEEDDDNLTTTPKDDSNEDNDDNLTITLQNNEDNLTSDSNENIIFHAIDADDQTENLSDHKYEILETETLQEFQTTIAPYTPEVHTSLSNLDDHNIIQEYVELRQDFDKEEDSMHLNKHILDKDFYGIISNNFNGESVTKFGKDIFVVHENLDRIKRNVNAMQNLNTKVYFLKLLKEALKDAQRNFK